MQIPGTSSMKFRVPPLLVLTFAALFVTQLSHCTQAAPEAISRQSAPLESDGSSLTARSPAGSGGSGPSSPTQPESPTQSQGSLSPLTSLSSWSSRESIKSQPPSPKPPICTKKVCLLTPTRPKKAGWFSRVRTAVGPVLRVPQRKGADGASSSGGQMRPASGSRSPSPGRIINPAESSADKMRYTYHLSEEGRQWEKDRTRPRIRSSAAKQRRAQKPRGNKKT